MSRYLRDRRFEEDNRFWTELVDELGCHKVERWSTEYYQQDQPSRSPAADCQPRQDMECSCRPRTSSPWCKPVGSPRRKFSRARQWYRLGRCSTEIVAHVDASSARSAELSERQSDQRSRERRQSDQEWPSGESEPVRLWHSEHHPGRRGRQLGPPAHKHQGAGSKPL